MTRRNFGQGRRRGRGNARRQKKVPTLPQETVEIQSIALQGDGESALDNGTRVFVPFTLPGDIVRVQPTHRRGDGFAATVVEKLSGADHASPICNVFGVCGGCQMQHVPTDVYIAWKTDVVSKALSRRGIDTEVSPLVQAPTNSRRRATFRAVCTVDDVVFGFNAPYTERVVPISSCPLLTPKLDSLIPALVDLLRDIMTPNQHLDVAVTVIQGNVDIVFKGADELPLAAREAIAVFARTFDIARISATDSDDEIEPLIVNKDVFVAFDDCRISMPALSFLQPSDEGETLIRDIVLSAIPSASRVADLYAGLGTFSVLIALAGHHVDAIDAAAPQTDALSHAAAQSSAGGRLRAMVRDLHKDPLTVAELNVYDAVIFDPPRSGARTQAAMLADSDVSRVVAVSCNPSTLARDLRLLIDGGYRLKALTPIDQFPQTYHVEAVAVLERA